MPTAPTRTTGLFICILSFVALAAAASPADDKKQNLEGLPDDVLGHVAAMGVATPNLPRRHHDRRGGGTHKIPVLRQQRASEESAGLEGTARLAQASRSLRGAVKDPKVFQTIHCVVTVKRGRHPGIIDLAKDDFNIEKTDVYVRASPQMHLVTLIDVAKRMAKVETYIPLKSVIQNNNPNGELLVGQMVRPPRQSMFHDTKPPLRSYTQDRRLMQLGQLGIVQSNSKDQAPVEINFTWSL